jgi:hypothetical protein
MSFKSSTVDNYCNQCKGVCWKGEDNFATQRAAKAKFGVIPNSCVHLSLGDYHEDHCPFKTQNA